MDDIVKQAQDNYQHDKRHWADIYDLARDDLAFLSDDDSVTGICR